MRTIITYKDWTIEKDEQSKYYIIDEIGTFELELIKTIPSSDKTEDELIDVDFRYDIGGETDEEIDGGLQYMYFIYK